ncbi:transposable element Tcb2 transposase [Trichonephila clavipes]|nr:transposable element Tcb2 transposase [Trichonephila clavipes]
MDSRSSETYAMKLLRAVDTRRYPRAENRVWSDQEDHEERGSKDGTAKPYADLTVTRSTIQCRRRRSNCSTNNFRHLAEANLKSKRPFRALPLTPEHRQLRLQWCQARSMRNVTYWQKVVFSDESRFVLGTDDNRVRVLRRPGERYNSPHTVLRHTAGTAVVMVWRALAYDSRSTLIVMRGTLTVQRYVDDILRPHVGPFLNGLPGHFSGKIMLVHIEQDLLARIPTSFSDSSMAGPLPRFVPCRARVGSAKTADAIVSLCT